MHRGLPQHLVRRLHRDDGPVGGLVAPSAGADVEDGVAVAEARVDRRRDARVLAARVRVGATDLVVRGDGHLGHGRIVAHSVVVVPTDSVTLHIDASPDAVWGLVSDITNTSRFNAETFEAEWIDARPG